MLIRSAAANDLPGILAIYNEAVLHTTASFDDKPASLDARLAWFEAHVKDDLPVFVAEDEAGNVAGWSALNHFRAWAGYRFTVENSVYVASPWRGQGVGKQLLSPLIPAAREREKHVIVAGMDANNQASIGLHQAFGFERVAHFKQVGYKFGRWLDLVFLQLVLAPTDAAP